MHRRELGDNLVALATQGSFVRGDDREFSDVELVAFLQTVPAARRWADIVQIWDGMLFDVVWTTKDEYIARVKEVTPDWYLAGSDRLGPLVNDELIAEVNAYQPADLRDKCRRQALAHWPVTQEATGKVLNALARESAVDLGRLFFSMLDNVLIDLAFLNARPYTSSSSSLQEALRMPEQPRGFDEFAAVAIDGAYTDLRRTEATVHTVFAALEELFEAHDMTLYTPDLALRRVDRP